MAGSPLARKGGPEVDLAAQAASAERRSVDSRRKAGNAAGVGQTDGDSHTTDERDADGRRLLESTPQQADSTEQQRQDSGCRDESAPDGHGSLLDLSG
jgi:hypothetical protein